MNNLVFPPFYEPYIKKVSGPVIAFLRKQASELLVFFEEVPEEKWDYAYEEGKWTLKEVLGHIIDVERIMAARALMISRGEKQSIPGFDENAYVAEAEFGKRSVEDLLDEMDAVRASNIILFESFSEEQISKVGSANGAAVSVDGIMHIVAGHAAHHMSIIKERYL